MRTDPSAISPGVLCHHWKGALYRIDTVATAEASGEPIVVYRPLAHEGAGCWTRTLADFVEIVEAGDGERRPRFVPIALPGDGALRTAAREAGVPEDVVEATLARYREPQRAYHASWHVHDVFARAARAGIRLDRAQVLALLFHDAVYVAGAPPGTNEALSALLLRQAAHGRDAMPAADVERACAMIADTAGHRPTVEGSLAVIALDLAGLADEAPRFDAWTELVWLEYRHLFAGEAAPKDAFLRRRVRVLRALLDSSRDLALLPGFQAGFEDNLQRLARRAPG